MTFYCFLFHYFPTTFFEWNSEMEILDRKKEPTKNKDVLPIPEKET